MRSAARPTNLLVVGNPGTGKSTLLNCLLGRALFRSGVSYGRGMTFEFEWHAVPPHTYMDTPGLADDQLREQAAAAITEALQCGGYYKIIFVVMLANGRVRAEDTATMKLVLRAAPITHFGIVLNQLPPREFAQLSRRDSQASAAVMESLAEGLGRQAARWSLCPVRRDEDLESADNVVKALPAHLVRFIEDLPGTEIRRRSVSRVHAREHADAVQRLQRAADQARAQEKAARAAVEQRQREIAHLRQQIEDQDDDFCCLM